MLNNTKLAVKWKKDVRKCIDITGHNLWESRLGGHFWCELKEYSDVTAWKICFHEQIVISGAARSKQAAEEALEVSWREYVEGLCAQFKEA